MATVSGMSARSPVVEVVEFVFRRDTHAAFSGAWKPHSTCSTRRSDPISTPCTFFRCGLKTRHG